MGSDVSPKSVVPEVVNKRLITLGSEAEKRLFCMIVHQRISVDVVL